MVTVRLGKVTLSVVSLDIWLIEAFKLKEKGELGGR
jgi:hypothetical protein